MHLQNVNVLNGDVGFCFNGEVSGDLFVDEIADAGNLADMVFFVSGDLLLNW